MNMGLLGSVMGSGPGGQQVALVKVMLDTRLKVPARSESTQGSYRVVMDCGRLWREAESLTSGQKHSLSRTARSSICLYSECSE